jgi:predicted CXXCH cytochrome family protein
MTGSTRLVDGRRLARWLSTHLSAGAAAAVAVLVVGFCLAAIAQDVKQAIPPDAKYVTSKLCGMCHKTEKTVYSETTHGKYEMPEGVEEPWRHSTGWDKATGTPSEPGVGCEACHGRGSAHMSAATKDDVDETALIIDPLKLETNDQRLSICAQCHARYTVAEGEPPVDFTPGENLLEKVTLLPPEPGQPQQQVNEFVSSKHYNANDMSCVQCHTAHTEGIQEHQLRKPINDLCTPCHEDQSDMAAHTDGKAKEGDTCATCHMPDASHAFEKPPANE